MCWKGRSHARAGRCGNYGTSYPPTHPPIQYTSSTSFEPPRAHLPTHPPTKHRLINETLSQLMVDKARHDEAEEGRMISALKDQNKAIHALLARVKQTDRYPPTHSPTYPPMSSSIHPSTPSSIQPSTHPPTHPPTHSHRSDPTAVLSLTEEVLSILHLPPPTLPPNVVNLLPSEEEKTVLAARSQATSLLPT